MSELFQEDGHLTDWGLQALVDEQLDEMQRLEASEHLAFCACCMDRYLDKLTGDVLLDPPQDLQLPVARGVRGKLLSQNARRWATAAVAAALSLTLWGTGVFQWIAPPRPDAAVRPGQTQQEQPWWMKEPDQTQKSEIGLTEWFSYGLNNVFGAVNRACNDLAGAMTPRMPDHTQATHELRGEMTHEK